MRYSQELETMPEVTAPPASIPDGRLCWFVYVVRLSARFTQPARDAIWRQLNSRGIGCGRYFAPLHQQPLFAPYVNKGNALTVTEQVAGRTLALPFFNHLAEEQIVEVCRALGDAVRDWG
jgi:perosamine synthetase